MYLVVGGAGGLGLKIVKYLLSSCNLYIALAGRSSIREEMNSDLADLIAENTSRVTYFQADVSKRHEARALIEAVTARFGRLSGVIHAAGVLRDSMIRRKTHSQFQEVLVLRNK